MVSGGGFGAKWNGVFPSWVALGILFSSWAAALLGIWASLNLLREEYVSQVLSLPEGPTHLCCCPLTLWQWPPLFTLTVPLSFILSRNMVGQARVIVLPKSQRVLMGCPSNLTWMPGRLVSWVECTTQPVSQDFLVGPRVVDLVVVSMGSS